MQPNLRMRPPRLSMFWATSAVVLLGLAVAAIGSWLLGLIVFGVLPGSLSPGPAAPGTRITWLDPIKVALTVAAGVGGAVALVVAYRKQRMAERQELQSAYVVAASQLGDANPTVRLAGVYAMANLADAWPARQQQCIDVLCGHLRLPWDANPDADHPLATKVVEVESDGTKTAFSYSDDRGEVEVRRTILRVMREHFEAKNWRDLTFDFTAATLPYINWSAVHVPPGADFSNVRFSDYAVFRGSTFIGEAHFNRATFSQHAFFDEATFNGQALFGWVTITGEALFLGAQFKSGAHFQEATFTDGTDFGWATFNSQAEFSSAMFTGETGFCAVTIDNRFCLQDATFNGPLTLDEAAFNGPVFFNGATFNGPLTLDDAAFNGPVTLDNAAFNGPVSLNEATYGLPRPQQRGFVPGTA